jgi:hypothetical protein
MVLQQNPEEAGDARKFLLISIYAEWRRSAGPTWQFALDLGQIYYQVGKCASSGG